MAATSHVAHRADLPTPLTSLVGRQRERAEVGALLGQEGVRLLTLTGAGGVGKTRLALRVAADIAAEKSRSVRFVSLAAIADPALVAAAIADACGLRPADDRPVSDALIAFLRDTETLLVLDNFEQVAESAPLLATLLAALPGLQLLVTSRVRLRLSGEHEYVVAPLPVIEPESDEALERALAADAVQLFIERARALDPGLTLSRENVRAIAAICQRLDGLPLAIELAAAAVKALPPPALLSRLERRLPLLTGGPRDVPARQRTMRDTIAWSYGLLGPEEQALFRRLSVFVGGFGLDGAASVAATDGGDETQVLGGVSALLDHHMLRRAGHPHDEPRYFLLETIREFGLEQLAASGEGDAIRGQHAAWCLSLAAALRLLGPGQADEMVRLRLEHDNLRAALAWHLERGDGEAAQRLAGFLWEFWFMAGHAVEGRRWLERALALGDAEPPVRAAALTGFGALAFQCGDLDDGAVAIAAGSALYRELGDDLTLGFTLGLLGNVAMAGGDYRRARGHFQEELQAYTRAGNAVAAGIATLNLGRVEASLDNYPRARALFEEARAATLAGDSPWDFSCATYCLGRVASVGDDPHQALPLFQEALALLQPMAGEPMAVQCLEGIARVTARADPETAALLLGAATVWRERMGRPSGVEDGWPILDAERGIRAALGAERAAAAIARGRRLSLDAAFAAGLAVALPDARPATDPAAHLGLTPREREVLQLLADGQPDRQIAAALFISPKTVGHHISRILAKLGVATRAAAVAYAHRHRLAEGSGAAPSPVTFSPPAPSS